MKKLFLFIFCLLTLCGCTYEFDESSRDKCTHICNLQMVASLMGFDDEKPSEAQTRSGDCSLTWTDGDQIYLFFEVGNSTVPGIATYSAANDQWTLEYTGHLAVVENAKVCAYYLKNVNLQPGSAIANLSANSCVYKDCEGIYSYISNDEIRIMASLYPEAGRIKFKGITGQTIEISGLSTYDSFNLSTSEITYSSSSCLLSVGNNGYTPYIYATFPKDKKVLSIKSDEAFFAVTCSSKILDEGKSGWMEVPTKTRHKGWTFFQIDNYGEIASTEDTLLLDIDSNEEWTVCSMNNSSWISFDKSSGNGDANVKVTISDNASVNSRNDVITVSSVNGLTANFPIIQAGKHINISIENLLADYNMYTTDEIIVDTDGKYTLESSAPWLSIVDKKDNSFKLSILENTSSEKRNATITAKLVLDNGEKNEKSISVLQASYGHGYRNGHEYVDLGLPSGKKWAVCNIGTDTEFDKGFKFAWGETKTKSSFSWDNYAYGYTTPANDGVHNYFIVITKYTNTGDVLSNSDDAGYVNYGDSWCTPSVKDWNELKNNCTWSEGGNGSYVSKGTGPNGCCIYFPTSYGTQLTEYWANSVANYWRRENGEIKNYYSKANDFYFYGRGASGPIFAENGQDRCYGYYIRPVVK